VSVTPPASGPRDDGTPPADALPADLDVTAFVGPYTFPDVRRRLIAAALHGSLGLGALAAGLAGGGGGFCVAAAVLGAIALVHVACAWPLCVDQTDALAVASRTVGFPIGHASAQLAFRGVRSRPVWQVLLYSADSPPSIRGLVELDAVDGRVLGEYTERNPEDWSAVAPGG
jgi:hypothetical protein